MSLLSFLFSLDSGGKGGGRAVKSCLCVGCKPMLKLMLDKPLHHSSRDSSSGLSSKFDCWVAEDLC